jgi:hypothetical protein
MCFLRSISQMNPNELFDEHSLGPVLRFFWHVSILAETGFHR